MRVERLIPDAANALGAPASEGGAQAFVTMSAAGSACSDVGPVSA